MGTHQRPHYKAKEQESFQIRQLASNYSFYIGIVAEFESPVATGPRNCRSGGERESEADVRGRMAVGQNAWQWEAILPKW